MRRRGLTLVDLLVGLMLVVMVGLFSLAATANLDTTANRIKCASNLRQIGQAILLYSNDSRGPYPRTKYNPDMADNPTAYTGVVGTNPFAPDCPQRNDVSAAMYNLLRTEDITAVVFICPATGKRPFDFGGGMHTALDRTNFPSGDNLSYSYANPYPSRAARAAGYKLVMGLEPTFAVAADMNPGTPQLTQLTVASSREEQRAGNSPNHSGDGQNILYGDGHVEFNMSSFAGTDRDNIYTYGASGVDHNSQAALASGGTGVFGSPVGPADSVLLPAVIVPSAAAATAPPPVAAPVNAAPAVAVAPVDQGTDFTVYLALASLGFLVLLLVAIAIVLARRRKTSGGQL